MLLLAFLEVLGSNRAMDQQRANRLNIFMRAKSGAVQKLWKKLEKYANFAMEEMAANRMDFENIKIVSDMTFE